MKMKVEDKFNPSIVQGQLGIPRLCAYTMPMPSRRQKIGNYAIIP